MAERSALQPRVDEDRRRPLVAGGEVGMKRADLDDFAARAPAQRVDGMAAGREQVAAAAGAGPHPVPAGIPVGHARQILRPREPKLAEPARLAQPARELQVRVVAQLERHDRPHAGRRDGVADADELLPRRGRSASRARCACPPAPRPPPARHAGRSGVAIEMMSTSGASSRSSYRVVSRASGSDRPCFSSVARARVGVAAVEPGHAHVRVLLEGGDVLRRAPADTGHPDAKFSITSRHRLSLD